MTSSFANLLKARSVSNGLGPCLVRRFSSSSICLSMMSVDASELVVSSSSSPVGGKGFV